MFGAEGTEIYAFQIEHADQAALQRQRNNQLGTHALAVWKFHVARILANVIHAKRLALTGCVTGDALVKRYAKPRWNRFAEVHGKNDFELRGLFPSTASR
jgi:hypothetical protein